MFTVTREEQNPLLSPNEKHPWEAAAVFNWCPAKEGRLTHALYRALSVPDCLDRPTQERFCHRPRNIKGRRAFFRPQAFHRPRIRF